MIQISLKWTNWTLQKTNTALLCISISMDLEKQTEEHEHWQDNINQQAERSLQDIDKNKNSFTSTVGLHVMWLCFSQLNSGATNIWGPRKEQGLTVWTSTCGLRLLSKIKFVHFEPKIIILKHLSKCSVNSQQKSYLEWVFLKMSLLQIGNKSYWKKNLWL